MVKTEGDPIERLKLYDKDLLIDNCLSVCEILNKFKQTNDNIIVDIVLDNAGYELFTDLCVAAFLTTHNYAKKIRFYVKRIPWFISDVTKDDFNWMIDQMKNSTDSQIQSLGQKCFNYLTNEQWTIEV